MKKKTFSALVIALGLALVSCANPNSKKDDTTTNNVTSGDILPQTDTSNTGVLPSESTNTPAITTTNDNTDKPIDSTDNPLTTTNENTDTPQTSNTDIVTTTDEGSKELIPTFATNEIKELLNSTDYAEANTYEENITDSLSNISLYSAPSDAYSYPTGNYGASKKISGIYFNYYRTYRNSSDLFISILKTNDFLNDSLYPSMLYNSTAIKGIRKITLNYKSADDFYILYGNDRKTNNVMRIKKSTDFATVDAYFPKSAFFRIVAKNSDVDLKRVDIYYDNSDNSNTDYYSYEGFRIECNYDEFDNILNGEVRSIPTKIKIIDNGYEILETKEYTYYKQTYVMSDEFTKDMFLENALTNPVDVANYYTLFHDFPVNYCYKEDISSYKSKFDSNLLRQVSYYTRTDGYVSAINKGNGVKVATNPVSGYPDYYELDFDVDGTYTTSSRGVGRLVAFQEGFEATGYSNKPVIVYTDDHYSTFMEYNNYGGFETRFNGESYATFHWINPLTTLIKK